MIRTIFLACLVSATSFAQTTLRMHAAPHPISGYLEMNDKPGAGLATSTTATTANKKTTLTDTAGGFGLTWISPPVAQAVTLNGPIDFMLWGKENSTKANASYSVAFAIYRNGAVLPDFTWGTYIKELSGQMRPREFAITSGNNPTLQPGDRLVLRIYIASVGGPMAPGYLVTTTFDGNVDDESGDSYVTFANTIQFMLGI
jgi:hypothetical protein